MSHKIVIGICDCCEEKITVEYQNGIKTEPEYVENEDGCIVCGDCLAEFTVDDWLEFTKYKWGTSEIPHNEFLREACEDDKRICDR